MVRVMTSRPDLAAHETAMRTELPALVKELRGVLGARLVAYIAGVSETRAIHSWADGARDVRGAETVARLRLTYQLCQLVTARDSSAVAQAWFQGLNPKLDDVSPARLLRTGAVDDVGPLLLAAARSFAATGA